MKICLISIGGTISQQEVEGRMRVSFCAADFIQVTNSDVVLEFVHFSQKTGANLQIKDLFRLKTEVEKVASKYDAFILLSGTDSLEEIAYGLDLILTLKKPFVITGAMRPRDALGYDGLRNFRDAMEVVKHEAAHTNGVLVVISEDIHAARYLRKLDSQALNAFESKPGPMGKIRRGVSIFYYVGLPAIKKYPTVDPSRLKANIPIVSIYLGCQIDPKQYENCDALVIAGMGTGSLPDDVIVALSEGLTRKIPICISTRCFAGDNYDDFYYKGSLDKYTSRGFLLEGYEGLSPYQARIRLMFELAENQPDA